MEMKYKISNSFRLVKNDMMKIQEEIIELNKSQERMMEIMNQLRASQEKLKNRPAKKVVRKTVTNKASKRTNKTYVATKDGKRFHIKECPFAQNILPKHKRTFKSKVKAMNEGYKACNCVK